MKKMFSLCIVCLAFAAAPALAGGNAAEGQSKSQTCQACHGADGNSTVAMYPRLAGQYETYLLRALLDYKAGGRKNPIMAGMVAALSEQDMADLAAFYASQKGLSNTQP